MDKTLGIYGAGGCGRGIMPLAAAQYGGNYNLVFIDDSNDGGQVNDREVFSFARFAALSGAKAISIAIADGSVRAKLAIKCEETGITFAQIMAEETVIMDAVDIAEGAIFSPYTAVTSNIRIGRHFHCNLYSYVEHDCIIGDFVTFAPAVRCNGNVTIGDGAYVGSGAVIKQGMTIGAGAVIGMGAIVTKDVAACQTVVGNPARPLIK